MGKKAELSRQEYLVYQEYANHIWERKLNFFAALIQFSDHYDRLVAYRVNHNHNSL